MPTSVSVEPLNGFPKPDSADRKEPIAIVGIGCRLPGGADSPELFWRLLSEGVDAIGEVPEDRWLLPLFFDADRTTPGKLYSRWGGFVDCIDQLDAQFFGIAPREAAVMDPQQRLLLETAWEALEDAGQSPEQLAGSNTGVFIGISSHDYSNLLSQPSERKTKNSYLALGSTACIAANRLSYLLDLRGPSFAVDTACSSSLVAAYLACQSIWNGESSLALVGGVNVILRPETTISFCNASMLSPDGRCKAFDSRANGYVRAEGAGVVVLKPMSQAICDGDRIYAVIRGGAVNQDGRTNGITVPSGLAQEAVIRAACLSATVEPADIQFVEAHGTGTPVGDPIEAASLGAVVGSFRDPSRPCAIGSLKTNIGHLEAGSGVASIIKVALALKHRQIPPSLHFESPNPQINFGQLNLRVPTKLESWSTSGVDTRLAGVNSFGFGGTNAHLILAEPPQSVRKATDKSQGELVVIPLSARTPEALRALATRYRDWLADENSASEHPSLYDLAYNTSRRRSHHGHRLAVLAASKEQVIDKLTCFVSGDIAEGLFAGRAAPTGTLRPVFVFTGMGPQWWAMGRDLIAHEPIFRSAIEECDQLFRRHADWSLLEHLFADEQTSKIQEAWLAQPAIFAIQVALAALWRSWGILPGATVGHSVGEAAAAFVAGALSLNDAVSVIFHRSRLQDRTRGAGRMLAAGISLDEARTLLSGRESHVSVAAINSPRSLTLSGNGEVLDDLRKELERRGQFCKFLAVDVPYHSPAMEPLRVELVSALSGLSPLTPEIPLYSTVTARRVEGPELDAAYWWENVREPVRFADAMTALSASGHNIYLEVGPHPVLASSIRECSSSSAGAVHVLHSLHRKQPDRSAMFAVIGQLYANGSTVDWQSLNAVPAPFVKLPTYPWQRERCWQETDQSHQMRMGITDAATTDILGQAVHTLLGRPVNSAQDGQTWHTQINLQQDHLWLADHKLHGEAIFPAAAYVEMALAAGRQLFADQKRTPTKIEFLRPLFLQSSDVRSLQFIYNAADHSFAIFSSDAVGVWTQHASGEFCSLSNRALPDAIDPEVPRSRCQREEPQEAWYRSFCEVGLEYGPAFQGVERVWCGDREALGRIQIPGGIAAKLGDYLIHPALLDASFQVLRGALASARGDGLYLPQKIERICVHNASAIGELRPAEPLWSYVRHIESTENSVKVDILVLDDSGIVLFEIVGLCCQVVAGSQKAAVEIDEYLYEDVWQCDESSVAANPLDESAAVRLEGAWAIFADDSGVGRAVAVALRMSGSRVITITAGEQYQRHGENEFQIHPTEFQDMQRLKDELSGGYSKLQGIIYLWSLNVTTADSLTVQSLRKSQDMSCCTVIHLLQNGLGATKESAPQLWLVTRGVQSVDRTEKLEIGQAPLWGLGRVVANEFPDWKCTMVDLAFGDANYCAAMLAREMVRKDGEEEVALRGTGRFIRRLRSTSLAAIGAAVPAPVHGDMAKTSCTFRLEITTPGLLGSLALRAAERRPPAPGEVELEVVAAGLNFKDVAKAMNLLGDTSLDGTWSGRKLGLECAGRITAVGDGVTGFKVGDEVLGSAAGCFASHVLTDARFIAPKPSSLEFEEAATIPVVFMTAYYALCHLASLKAGERVLIHAAAGGVGLAAIQLAQLVGAEVFATAGNSEKRELLRGLGVAHVMDSRSVDFAEEVLALTSGEGVDVILNSLTGDAVPRSLAVLRSGGRFLELGKRDIEQNRKLSLRLFQDNIAFFAIDLDRLWVSRPELMAFHFREIMAKVATQVLRPLPYRVFPISDAAAAFEHMARARHVGKVVLSLRDKNISINSEGRESIVFPADATYLITGGLGGFGLATAQWMVQRGARSLVLVGRKGASSDEARTAVDALREKGAAVHVAKADVTQHHDLERVFTEMRRTLPPLKGVIHAAMVLDDALLPQLNADRVDRVLAPKVLGAWNLHHLTQSDPIDFFIMYSSAATTVGNPGQANYVAANTFLDLFAHYRRSQGLPALTVNWTAVADAGYLTQHAEISEHLERLGLKVVAVRQLLSILGELIKHEATQTTVMLMDWKRWSQIIPANQSRRLSEVIAAHESGTVNRSQNDGQRTARGKIEAAAEPERLELIERCLREHAAKVLGTSGAKLELDQPLVNLGLDSLMAVELALRVEKDLEIDIPTMKLMSGISLAGLTKEVLAKIVPFEPERYSDVTISASEPVLSSAPVINWEREILLDPAITCRAELLIRPTAPAMAALLTGATGFLGSFLLNELLRRTNLRIYCLVRAATPAEAGRRLHNSLQSYGLWVKEAESRVVPVVGELTAPLLGLSPTDFEQLGQQVDVIYHNGARLSLAQSYAALKPTNVCGTSEILRLACHSKLKCVHFVSSLGIFDLPADVGGSVYSEADVPNHLAALKYGYTQSKAVAELLVRSAGARGIPVVIYRPGLINAASTTGAYTSEDFAAQLLKSWIMSGSAPAIKRELLFTPVDYVSRAIVFLGMKPDVVGQTFHLVNPQALQLRDLVSMVGEAGYDLKLAPYKKWRQRLIQLNHDAEPDGWNSILPLLPPESGPSGEELPLWPAPHMAFDCSSTVARLLDGRISCPPADQLLIERCLGYFRTTGFLPAPGQIKHGKTATAAKIPMH